jgi:TetR/AcrR family transcriptional regulator
MDNRNLLLDQALALFAARGYDSVGVQEICDAASVTKPTLYHYFGCKRGLLEGILTRDLETFKALLSVAAIYTGDLPLTLERMAFCHFDFAIHHPVFYRFYLTLAFAPRESEAYQALITLNHFQFDMIENVFLMAVTQHGNMRGRHQASTLTFLGMVNNYIGLGLNGLATLDEALARQAVHQFQHGIYS